MLGLLNGLRLASGIAAYIPGSATSPATTTYRYDPTTYDLLERDTAEGARTVYSYDGRRHQVTSVIDRLSSLSPCRQSFAVAQVRPSRTISGVHKSRGRHRQITPHVRPHTDCAPTGDRWRGTITAYDARGQLVATTDARGVIVPDTSIGQTPVAALNPTPPVAATRSYTYTPAGDLWSVSSPPITTLNPSDAGQTTGPVTTTYGSDADGNQLTVTSPNGPVTTAGYDHLGRLTQLAQPPTMLFDGNVRAPTATIDYDGDGNVARTTDGAGDPTTRAYDPLGRLTSSTNAVGETTVLTYTATRLAQVLTPAGNTTSYTYDAAGRRTGMTDPNGTLTQFGLDAVGNTTAITVPLDTQGARTVDQRTYDGLNQLATDTWQGTNELTATVPQTTTYSYDHDGNLVQAQAPNGDVTYRTYDYADRPRAVTIYPSGALAPVSTPLPAASQTFTLDNADNLTDQTDFSQRDHAFSVDGDRRVTQQVDTCLICGSAAAITTTTGFDPDGNVRTLLRQEDGAGATGAYTATYNALDWLMSQDDGQGPTTFGYDAAGRPWTQSLLGGAGVVTATLDAAGRATSISETVADAVTSTVSTGSASTFSYTPDDLPYVDTLPGNVTETRYYDGNDRVGTVDAANTAGSIQLLQYGRNPQEQTTAITLTTYGLYQQIAHNALGYVTANAFGDGSVRLGRIYRWGYDGNGNITARTDGSQINGVSATYGYAYTSGITPANWLPNELITTAITPSDGPAQTTQYGYDPTGNTTAITATSAVTGLAYNSAGLFTGATLPDGRTVAVTYNARGLRDTLSVTPAGQTQPSWRERFLYRGNLVGQVSVTGTAPVTDYSETFLYRPDGMPLELLYRTPGQPTQRYWYVLNAQGSVLALTDASGTAVDQYAYDLWGVPSTPALVPTGEPLGEQVLQPLRYAGYFYDGWAGGPLPWYWLAVRYYDPVLERFLQPDPSSQDGVRSYVYAHDDPVDLVDPSGQAGVEPPEPPVVPTLGGGPALGAALSTEPLGAGIGEAGDGIAIDENAQIAQAKAARQVLQTTTRPPGKVIGATTGGLRVVSGWRRYFPRLGSRDDLGFAPPVQRAVLRTVSEMDPPYVFAEAGEMDQGIPGQFNASHVEPQIDQQAPGEPFAVSSQPCESCLGYLQARATATGVARYVAVPSGVIAFYPDSRIEFIPDAPYPAITEGNEGG